MLVAGLRAGRTRWTAAGALLAAALGALPAACVAQEGQVEAPAGGADDAAGLPDGLYARLQTNRGVMILLLEHERTPMTVGNFVGLIEGTREWTDPKSGQKVKRPYYDGLGFHRIIDGFMIQGGCPQGTGMGGPGYQFKDEIHPELKHEGPGVLSMANAGPATNGSQFFVTLGPTPHLDGRHSVFGRLVRGQDVLAAIGKSKTGAMDRPVDPVVIQRATVLRVGEAAKAWSADEAFQRGEREADALRERLGRKDVPDAQGEADPARVPGADQPLREQARLVIVCIQHKGAHRAAPHVKYDKDEALALARKIVAHARLAGADVEALGRRWSDVPTPPGGFALQRAQTDPSFAPAFRLTKGQVSDAVLTPFGAMVFQALD